MCGIFGYSGNKDASKLVVEGLKRLEYRGYDSWGVAVQTEGDFKISKKTGQIGQVEEQDHHFISHSTIAIGHTRWATHGGVTVANAHPHPSTDGSFVLAQNGIVENYQELKAELIKKGYKFNSQTDTEVIVRLVEEKLKKEKNLRKATREAFLDLHGRNTIILLKKDKSHIIAVRNGSPLVVGVGKDEFFVASDTLSFANHTDKVVFLNDNEMIELIDNDLEIYDVKSGKTIDFKIKKLDHEDVTIDKEGYDHFMLKEIVEQKHTIREAIQYTEDELAPLLKAIQKARNVYTIGAGTAAFAASQIAYFLREFALVRAVELKSYEIGSYKNLFGEGDLILAVSQSGETADTIEALEVAKSKGVRIASIVNMVGSTLTRMSDFAYLSRSGPEICVASTKAFTAQVSWGLLVALSIAGKYDLARKAISKLSGDLENYFGDELFKEVKKLVKKLKEKEHFFILGKGQNASIAVEGALKIKEITYKHFEGFTAGELKHGVIALIEKGTPVFVIVSKDENKQDLYSAAAEVKSRGAYIIGIGKENNELFDDFIKTPEAGVADSISNVVPFQLISYFLGVELGNSPDKPRNLAKSVTVK